MADAARTGTLFLLDGPSGAGKSTVTALLLDTSPVPLRYVPRYTTRARRPSDEGTDEYVFVDADRFATMAAAGQFIEYKHFLFGMSYGLPVAEADAIVASGSNALGLMNLGNIEQVRRQHPEAITILLAISPQTVAARLARRGTHTPEEIAERVKSAELVAALADRYHHVVPNADGALDETLAQLRAILREHGRP